MTTAEEYIRRIYPTSTPPLYLSTLGALLKKDNIAVSNLREFVEHLPDFTVVQGVERERTAIASIEDEDKIKDLLKKDADKASKENITFLAKLPRNLLFAFASKPNAEDSLYIGTEPPYKFQPTPKKDLLEIESSLLIKKKIPVNLNKLDKETAELLQSNIQKWSRKIDIDIDTVFKKPTPYSSDKQTTLLEEMINAIPAQKRAKVVLPLDVIEFLIKKR
ncbi:hypothetical protein [Maridesulfovibrio sp.]|uniref:hypothetical protein n=1 Tax=Maridesulfovibrio sp. TaxID=2795000 RepID=UPI003AFF6DB4